MIYDIRIDSNQNVTKLLISPKSRDDIIYSLIVHSLSNKVLEDNLTKQDIQQTSDHLTFLLY
jgi:hypothetical protein